MPPQHLIYANSQSFIKYHLPPFCHSSVPCVKMILTQQVGELRVMFVQSLLAKELHVHIRMCKAGLDRHLVEVRMHCIETCLLLQLLWSILNLRVGVALGYPHYRHISPLTETQPWQIRKGTLTLQ